MKGEERSKSECSLTDGDSELKSDENSLGTKDMDTDSEKDLFEESFQDLDLLSHIESIEESQNSVDITDVKKITVSDKRVKSGQVMVSPNSRAHEKTGFITENSMEEKLNCESIGKSAVKKRESICYTNFSKTTRTGEQVDNEMRTKSLNVTEDFEKVLNSGNVGSLRDRLKRKLLQNVGGRSPMSPALTIEQGRLNQLKEAELEAAIIQEERSADDIGPFYGLPSKVQQLLQDLRGITSLYGINLFFPSTLQCSLRNLLSERYRFKVFLSLNGTVY